MIHQLVHWLRAAVAVQRSRRQLCELKDAQLADIGVTRAQAAAEIARPFWDFSFDFKRPPTAPRGLVARRVRGGL